MSPTLRSATAYSLGSKTKLCGRVCAHSGPIQLFLVPASAPLKVQACCLGHTP